MRLIKNFCFRMAVIIAVLSFGFSSLYANTDDFWNGHWAGKNAEGDMVVDLIISKDNKQALNPNDANSMSNAFMTVFFVEPSGRKTVLSTYEFVLAGEKDNILTFDFKGGREAVDNASGKCNVFLNDKSLVFKVTDHSGDNVVFDNMSFSKDGTVVVNTEDKSAGKTDVMGIIVGILVLLIFVGMAGHMLYLLFRGDRYKKTFTADGMIADRVAQGKPEHMTEEEYDEVVKSLDSAFEQWSVVGHDDNGNELRKPTKMKQIKSSALLIDKVIAMQPTEDDLVARLNDLTAVVNSNEKRYFDGSKPLVWLGFIVGIVLCFVMGPGVGVNTIVATGIYIIASRTPMFLIEKRSKRGGGNIHNSFIAGIFAMIAGAQTVRTITTYSDGHKEVDDDHSEHWIALFFGLVLLIAIAIFMFLWAILNYLRNYVFYF